MFRNAAIDVGADQLLPTDAILAPMPADDPRQLRPATLDEIAESCPSRSSMTAAGASPTPAT